MAGHQMDDETALPSQSAKTVLQGEVDENLRLYFTLPIGGPGDGPNGFGVQGTMRCRVDTGYDGAIGLPTRYVEQLKLNPWPGERGLFRQADGQVHERPIYEVFVGLANQIFRVRAVEMSDTTEALIGCRLLRNCRLEVSWVPGGAASLAIEQPPTE